MIRDNIGLIEMLGSFGLVLAFLIYQYWSDRTSIARDRKTERESADRARHSEREHRLDDR